MAFLPLQQRTSVQQVTEGIQFFMMGNKEVAMDREKVLEEYRNGDEGRRLSLFLSYRDLRGQFCSIEQESPHDDFTIVKFPWSRKSQVARAA